MKVIIMSSGDEVVELKVIIMSSCNEVVELKVQDKVVVVIDNER